MSKGRSLGKLKSALGWPVRRMLNPRFEATVHAVDYRLGSFDGARPSIHQRLDEIEVKLDRLTMELRANDEALSAILEHTQRMTSSFAPGPTPPPRH